MQEVTVDVTEQTGQLLQALDSEDPMNLIEKQALMAFRSGKPIAKSVFLLPREVAVAAKPQPVGPWLPQEVERTGRQQGNGRASAKAVWKPRRSCGAT